MTGHKHRAIWEKGGEDASTRTDLLEQLNATLENDVRTFCTAKIWTYGGRQPKHEVQVSVNLLEHVED